MTHFGMPAGTRPGTVIRLGVALVVGSIIGLTVSVMLNAFVLDAYNAYGEVAIPGSGTVELPAGKVSVSLHTRTTGGNGLPVPTLGMSLVPPPGVPEPAVTESIGGTTTVNTDAHVRVWVAQIHAAGTYGVRTSGNVNGYIEPQLAFGHSSRYWPLTWAFGALGGVGLALIVVSALRRARGTATAIAAAEMPPQPASAHPAWSYEPTDDGVRFQQLKTLADLRDSGALTEAEFEAEKRRLLDER